MPRVVLVVNKMDLAGWDVSAFEQVVAEFRGWSAALGLGDVPAVPVSALQGDNVVIGSQRSPWYAGPTLLDLLETIEIARPPSALRFPVQYVVRAPERGYRGYAGRVAGGAVRTGDDVVVLPSGVRTSVTAVETADGPLEVAPEGRSVVLRLADDVDVARGDLLAPSAAAAAADPGLRRDGRAGWPRSPWARRRYLLRHTTRTTRALVEAGRRARPRVGAAAAARPASG